MNRIALPSSCRINVLQLPQIAGRTDEDIVMIHGLAANLGFWYPVAAHKFQQYGRVTLYDMRGHGRSDMPPAGYSPRQLAEELGQLLDHLQLRRVHLIAHSFGGMVGLAFALLHPNRVKSIILADVRVWQVEPPSWASTSPAWLRRMRAKGLRLEKSHIDPSFQVLVELARLRMQHEGSGGNVEIAIDDNVNLFRAKRAAQRWLDLMEGTNAYSEMTSASDFVELNELSRIRLPMLAAFGEHSLRRRSARALKRLCPQCRVVIVPRAGHFFPFTRPKYFADMALEFLTATKTADSAAADDAVIASPAWVSTGSDSEIALADARAA